VNTTAQPVMQQHHADAPAWQALLGDRSQLLSVRVAAAVRLGSLGITPEAPAATVALAAALNQGHEHLNLRVAACLSLGQLGGPRAAEALSVVVFNHSDERFEAPNGTGGRMPFQLLAHQALAQFPHGQARLRQIVLQPQGSGRAWGMALSTLYGSDYSTLIELASATASDLSQALEVRLHAVAILGAELNPGDRAGWDGLASIALARSEPELLRRTARAALDRRRP
jgi:hypothetical protein